MSRFFFQFIPPLWLGLLIGISFIEAPLKFQAPGITLALGLGIGELVFGVLNKVELVLMLGLLASAFIQKKQVIQVLRLMIGLLCVILLIQTIALFPELNERIAMIQAGETPPASNAHIFYIIGEGLKVILLGILSYKIYQIFSPRSPVE